MHLVSVCLYVCVFVCICAYVNNNCLAVRSIVFLQLQQDIKNQEQSMQASMCIYILCLHTVHHLYVADIQNCAQGNHSIPEDVSISSHNAYHIQAMYFLPHLHLQVKMSIGIDIHHPLPIILHHIS